MDVYGIWHILLLKIYSQLDFLYDQLIKVAEIKAWPKTEMAH